jgi:hypothetical protein
MRLPINEEFDNALGRWDGYDAYDYAAREALKEQQHTDLRVFQHLNVATGGSILDLNPLTMSDLAADGMEDVTGSVIVEPGEAWNIDTVGPDPIRSNFRTLRAALAANTTTTVYSRMETNLVDLSDYEPDDFISVALPSFPAASLDLTQTFLRLGDGTNTVNVPFTASVLPITLNTELRIPLSAFAGIDLSHIIDVGFVFRSTAATTVVAMSYRAISKTWRFMSLDYDTRYQRLRRAAPRNGDLAAAPEFTQPIMWRGSSPPAEDDPKPIDGEVGVLFNTGSMTGTNQFAVYFREQTDDYLTMGDLNGEPMSGFDGQVQPDVGAARYNLTTQDDLGRFTQEELDNRIQFDLERTPDNVSALWTQFLFQWSATRSTITISNTEASTYTFDAPALTPGSNYIVVAHIEENEVRARVFAVDIQGNVGALIFDTTTVIDDNVFKRRKGRFGWWASLNDGDATVEAIHDRGFTYAEYRSVPMKSNTPVVGAELFVGTSPNTEHFEYFTPGIYNRNEYALVERDTAKSTSGESWRITDFGTQVSQGVQTNAFPITDFVNTEISFDLFYPSSAILAGTQIGASLIDAKNQRTIPLLMPEIVPDQWQHIRILMPQDQLILTGNYRLIIYGLGVAPSIWWVDNVNIFTRTVIWEGRAVVDDAWKTNDARWTPFRNILNRENGGILFPHRGTELQVRAKGIAQTAVINRIQFKAKYAELGNFKPGVVTVTNPSPTASFTSTGSGVTHGIRFTNTSTDDGTTILAEWNFGDGSSGIGDVVTHTYDIAGTYNVTLVVTDNYGA